MDIKCTDGQNCNEMHSIRERVIVLETNHKNFESDMTEVKDNIKTIFKMLEQNKNIMLTTLGSSLLGLVGIIVTFVLR